MNKAVILLCLLLALPLSALDNADTLEFTGLHWLSWTPEQRLSFLAGVTHGEVNTVLRIGLSLKTAGYPDAQIQSEIFPYGCYEGNLEDLSRAITTDILSSPAREAETLLVLIMSNRWHISPQEPIE